ncbi:MAG: hypothetical protein E4H17_03980 [Gemmatimonadales bacterium]|nr:MAG: hypothetical protein E4H17_03980 [Gemmatimonadales bacterium]
MIPSNTSGEPITEMTLRKHFRVELDRGAPMANTRVVGSLFKNATTNENVTAQIFWLKTRLSKVYAQAKEGEQPEDLIPTETADLFDTARRIAYVLKLTVQRRREIAIAPPTPQGTKQPA